MGDGTTKRSDLAESSADGGCLVSHNCIKVLFLPVLLA